jgi:predicted RNA-binding Zn ribbon-like protein
MPDTQVGPDAFPLLGEPFVAEFANTLYQTDTETIDFLATRLLPEAWFRHAHCAGAFDRPRLNDKDLQLVRELRNAVHMICTHIVDDIPGPATKSTEVLNRTSRLATAHVELEYTNSQRLMMQHKWSGKAEHVFLARLATETIVFFAGDDSSRLRRCATPVCNLLFVKEHHRRNFCTEHCSQRTRQNRYFHNKPSRQ